MSSAVEELLSMAQRLRREMQFADAKGAAERAIELEPDNAAAWFNLGAALGGLGDLARAEAAYRQALARNGRYAEAWSNLAGVFGATGRVREQLDAYQQALGANSALAPIWSNLGNALCALQRYGEAEDACRRALALDDRFVPAWLNLARALHESKRPAEARDACRRALELAPGMGEVWASLGNACMGVRDFPAAIAAYRKASALRPDSADFHANLGIALWRVGADGDARASLGRAIELVPSHNVASWHMAMSLLQHGELAEGWERYESRWARPDSPARRFALKGTLSPGRKALLWGEQGIGDHVLYARMAAEVAQMESDVTLEVDPRLTRLFQRSFPGVRVVPQTDPPRVDPAQFDCVMPLGSLGRLLRPSFQAFPTHSGYLIADAARTKAFREMLAGRSSAGSLIVGIAWRSTNPELAAEKTAPLDQWAPVLSLPGIQFVSLQYGDVDAERRSVERRFGTRIATLPDLDLFNDIDGLAALESACDLVLTTSTVNAHLTGALGLPGLLLLPQRIGSIWYWFIGREDSPWYPSLTLIRQTVDGDWTTAMSRAAALVRQRLAQAG